MFVEIEELDWWEECVRRRADFEEVDVEDGESSPIASPAAMNLLTP